MTKRLSEFCDLLVNRCGRKAGGPAAGIRIVDGREHTLTDEQQTQSLDASLLAGAASVVRDRGDVLDQLHFQAGCLQRGDGAFTSRAGAFDANFHVTHAELRRLFGGLLSGTLSSKRSALAATLESTGASAGPAEGVAFDIGDGHRCVVKGRVNVGDTIGDITPNAFLFIALCHGKVLIDGSTKAGLLALWSAGQACWRGQHKSPMFMFVWMGHRALPGTPLRVRAFCEVHSRAAC